MKPSALLSPSSAYRWLYLDVSSGDFTAVVIFMLGAPFSPRYSVEARRGASPAHHCAVNLAVYEKGARHAWVLSEYGKADLDSAVRVRIGGSQWTYENDGSATVVVSDHTAQWGEPTQALISLVPESPRGPDTALVEGVPHFWQALAPRAWGRVTLPSLGLSFEGRAYHDTNHGDVMLGQGVQAWRWTRTHGPHATRIVYEPRGHGGLEVTADATHVDVLRAVQPRAVEERRLGWGLRVPSSLSPIAGVPLEAPRILESSPFYARLEAVGDGHHAMTEVADFARFHQPHIRWMADFRTRVGEAR